MTDWINIKKIKDDDIFYTGVAIRLLPTKVGLAKHHYIPKEGLLYVIAENAGDFSTLELVCLSIGEVGNVCCVLQKQEGKHYINGKEFKKMLMCDLQDVLICKSAKFQIV